MRDRIKSRNNTLSFYILPAEVGNPPPRISEKTNSLEAKNTTTNSCIFLRLNKLRASNFTIYVDETLTVRNKPMIKDTIRYTKQDHSTPPMDPK